MNSTSRRNPLNVSIVTGVMGSADATSNICRQQMNALAAYGRAHGLSVNLRLYVLSARLVDSRISVVDDAVTMAVDDHFLNSDVILYHFGYYLPLFESIHLAPRLAKVVVYYHGITPPRLIPRERAVLYDSYRQAANMHLADQVLTTSQFLVDELVRMGLSPASISRVPPAVSFRLAVDPVRNKSGPDEVRVAYVGRFVPSKGVIDLLRAAQGFVSRGDVNLKLALIGNRAYSDDEYLQTLSCFVRDGALDDHVEFVFEASDRELVERLAGSDVVVIPSYHEGFCIPVIEAFACGCFVICSDSGALPETSAGLGRTFATGNADQLHARLEEFVAARRRGGFSTDRGFIAESDWHERARQYASSFSHDRWQEQFCAALLAGLTDVTSDIRHVLADARRDLLSELNRKDIRELDGHAIARRVSAVLADVAKLPS